VLSPRFGDIFRGNAGKSGLLTASVEHDVVERLWATVEADPSTSVTVDLVARQVIAGDVVAPIEVDDYTRWRLLEGVDDIGLTLRHVDKIERFEVSRPSRLPRTVPSRG
jgi:3-isopropylmalate/(R)-2-methylmalate dehydratase small subunit